MDSWTSALLPQFLDMTASRQIEIDMEREMLDMGGDPLPAVAEIGKIAHKIAGTAESFGFAALGKQAQTIEHLCRQIAGLDALSIDSHVAGVLRPALDALSKELDLALFSGG